MCIAQRVLWGAHKKENEKTARKRSYLRDRAVFLQFDALRCVPERSLIDQFHNNHRGVIPLARSKLQDAGVAPVASFEALRAVEYPRDDLLVA